MVKGILSLLSGCPPEVAHTRKEMLIAARHIVSTELKIKFVPHMEQLFNEVCGSCNFFQKFREKIIIFCPAERSLGQRLDGARVPPPPGVLDPR